MPDTGFIEIGAAVLGAGGGGAAVLALVQKFLEKRRSPEQRIGDAAASAADLVPAIMAAARELMKDQQAEIDALRAEIRELKSDHEKCLSDARQLNQKYESLESWLRNQGLDVPENRRPGLIKIEGGRAEMTTPTTPNRRKPRK